MRTLTIRTVFLLGLGAVLLFGGGCLLAQPAQYQPAPPVPVQPFQPGGGGPPNQWQPPPGGPPRMQGGGMQGEPPPWMQQGGPAGGQRGPGGRGAQPGAMQGNQPARPGQPGAGGINANMVTQIMARLRAMDTNGNGILEPNEIPANQMGRLAPMAQRFGVDISRPVNLADLERRAMSEVANSPQQPDQAARRQQRPQQQVDPLVKPFGETQSAETSVVGFGQREPTPQSTPPAGGGERQRNTAAAQANQQAAVQAARSANAVKLSSPYDHISQAVRDNQNFSWFFAYDTDKDAQLTMQEYVNGLGGVWTAGVATEFRFLDRNDDGFVTVDEALTSIKEKDEAAALQAREQQAAAGSQPGQPAGQPSTGRPAAQNGRPPGNNQGGPRRQREMPNRN